MNDTVPISPEEEWRPPLPYSERALPDTGSAPRDQTPTTPLEFLAPPALPPSVTQQADAPEPAIWKGRTLEPLGPEELAELSDEAFLQLRLQTTAYFRALTLFHEKSRLPAPDPYLERFYIWKMLFKQVAPVATLLTVAAVTVSLLVVTGATGWTIVWAVLGLLLVALGCAWFVYRIYYIWRHTFLFSDVQETGIRRPRNRWLFLTELEQTVETASLQTKDPTRGNFASFFNLNCWRVALDAPAQKDNFLNDLRFVRNGNRLKQTIIAGQQYLRQSER